MIQSTCQTVAQNITCIQLHFHLLQMQNTIAVGILNRAAVMHQSALNINNINTRDNVCSAVIIEKSLREFKTTANSCRSSDQTRLGL